MKKYKVRLNIEYLETSIIEADSAQEAEDIAIGNAYEEYDKANLVEITSHYWPERIL